MIDISVQADGLKAPDAVELVTKPLEAIVKSVRMSNMFIARHKMIVSWLQPDLMSEPIPDDAILRIHEKIRTNYDQMPMDIPEPLIVGRGINDVAIVR